jgi:hypothetical protein
MSEHARLPVWFHLLLALLATVALARALGLVLHRPLLAFANNYDQIRYTACLDLAPWRPGERADRGNPQAPLSRYAFQPLPRGTCIWTSDLLFTAPVAAVWRLGRGWEAGGTFRLVSGNPETPIVGRRYNASTGIYSPVYGALNSDRNPSFNRLDLRVEKEWRWPDWKLALYLDVQNVYNAENPEGTIWDFEFRQKDTIRGLPIIPNIGIRGEI